MTKPTKATLERLYLDEKKAMSEIGRLYGVHKNQVRRWLLQAAIPTRSVGEGHSLARKGKKLEGAALEIARQNAAKARQHITPESRAKHAAKMKGRTAPNKGKKWTPEERVTHMKYRKTPEYRKKLSDSQKGEKANNWRGGKIQGETLRMNGWEWKWRRKECYARDNWSCQDCGIKCGNKGQIRIQAHHIIPRRHGGGDELENLLTLCASCHKRREMRFADALIA